MGSDIHSVGQVRKDGKWETVIARPGGDDRNYDTFAVLADVRNGRGFAGSDTGEGWPVMFPQRGLPDDIKSCDIPLKEPFYWSFDEGKKDPQYKAWLGDHSHSWLTLTELRRIQSFFADRQYEKHGMLSAAQLSELRGGKAPTEWCSFTNHPGYVTAAWRVPALDCLWGLNKLVKAMDEVASTNDAKPDDVRIVFGFDS